VKPNNKLAAGLAAALAAGALSAVGIAAPAQATAVTLSGSPSNQAGLSAYGTPDITIDAVQDGADVDVTVSISQGPTTPVFAGFAANSYRLDAFVRMDGAATDRGVLATGVVGTVAVAPNSLSYPTGTTASVTFPNVSAGAHTFTVTDLVADSNSALSTTPTVLTSGLFGTAADGSDKVGFDAWYNKSASPKAATRTTTGINADTTTGAPLSPYTGGTTSVPTPAWDATAQAATPYVPIGVSDTINVVAPVATVATSSAQANGAQTIARNSPAGGPTAYTRTIGLTGTAFTPNVAAGITVAFCDTTGVTCPATPTVTNSLTTDGTGAISGNVVVPPTSTLPVGAGAIKITGAYGGPVLVPVTVLSNPTLTLSPAVGKVGTVVNVSGDNWNAGQAGLVTASDGTGQASGANANALGAFSVNNSGVITSGSITIDTGGVDTQSIFANQGGVVAGPPGITQPSARKLFKFDGTAPTGSAVVAPTSGNVGLTSTLTVSNVVDATAVSAAVTWGDGSAAQNIGAATTATHKYTKAGSFPVSVVLTDAAGNSSAAIAAGTVTVKAPPVVVPPVVKDTTAPVVKVKALASKASKVKAIKGTITDKGGAKSVTIKVIEKRGSKWYAFNGKKFVKVKSKKAALKKAKSLTDTSVATGWSIKVKGLKKGTVYVSYFGTDKAGNKSKTKTYSKKLK
jgi:hypothetical protein